MWYALSRSLVKLREIGTSWGPWLYSDPKADNTHVKADGLENINNFTLIKFAYLNMCLPFIQFSILSVIF